MGNVLFASTGIIGKTGAQVAMFGGANPADIQSDVQALIDALILEGADGIQDIALAGTGDGHTFVCSLVYGPNAARTLAAGTTVRCFMASTEPELSVQMTAALAAIPPTQLVVGHAKAGSALGRRWMGILVSEDAG